MQEASGYRCTCPSGYGGDNCETPQGDANSHYSKQLDVRRVNALIHEKFIFLV